MKVIGFFLWSTVFLVSSSRAQVEKIQSTIQQHEVEAHIRFLASDELKGRDTGSPEVEIAALYIAESFRSHGLTPVQGAEDYFQPVKLVSEKPPSKAVFSYQEQEFNLGDHLLILSGDSTEIKAPVVYANYALAEDLKGMDIEGKVVVAKAGTPSENSPQSFFFSSRDKLASIRAKGGLALVELYRSNQMPWSLLVKYLNTEQLSLDEEKKDHTEVPLIWLNDPQGERLSMFQDNKAAQVTLSIAKKERKEIPAKNVVAMVEGTDPTLKDQFVILTAHYDHVGVGNTGAQDSIYNGARDNAVGTTALLSAAAYFGQHPPKRSILFLAVTAEEKGMLGSAWYANHPLIPLDQVAFNLNTDGAGYNDTTKVTVIGLERTTAEEELLSASQDLALTAIKDPVPEQNLYDRSDNVSFASKGIPAVTFSPGITAFDQEVMKYYHQTSDEVESLNFSYVEKFIEAYTLATERIANMQERPFWREGDKYENEGKELYGR